jgi:small ligand-binding sensory domain FIST
MSSESFRARKDIAQTIRIDQLVKDNASLIIQLQDSDAAIGHLRFQIERLQDGTQTLTMKLEDSIKEVGRISVALKDRNTTTKSKQPHAKKVVFND